MDLSHETQQSVIIATHNRRDDLRRTLQRLTALDPAPAEIIVCCDGCTDGTPAMLRAEFAEVIVLENSPALGSVGSRCRLMAAARHEIVLSFDDDSYPVERDFLARVHRLFHEMPRLGIASFPQRTDEFPDTLDIDDFGPSQFVASYAASAAAFRRSAYLEVPGWDAAFRHTYEEPDLALQLAAAGWMTFRYTSVTVRHHYSWANRDEERIHHINSRNEQWSVWKRCPFPQLLAVSLYRAARQFAYARQRGWRWLVREPLWWPRAAAGLPHCLRTRRPVRWKTYRGWMRLFRHPIATEEEWHAIFRA